jgi:CTP synthase
MPEHLTKILAGLVAASSGQLDQRGVISKTSRCISNTGGASKLKACQNGHLMKPLKGLVNGHYSTTSNGAIPI